MLSKMVPNKFIGQQLYQMTEPYREPERCYWAREKKAASAEADYQSLDAGGRIVPEKRVLALESQGFTVNGPKIRLYDIQPNGKETLAVLIFAL